ncbi:hypothetical protein ABOM_010602 [Aspergillus bombycis]|uniref:Uncharacterized protein n=1 Tax=Aspergillus bombycis TaxID=109264 RepID=A0A1F7ZMK7_9EURO|nr:hypothetical protein ABOM_010602 [Aspergillus bombycis]OGM40358.1 hypothetical protein ABOM_010602 [Aspergillus bombycis]
MKLYIPLTLLFAALAIAAPAETETDDSVLADTEAAPALCRDITRYNNLADAIMKNAVAHATHTGASQPAFMRRFLDEYFGLDWADHFI